VSLEIKLERKERHFLAKVEESFRLPGKTGGQKSLVREERGRSDVAHLWAKNKKADRRRKGYGLY